MDSYVAFLVFVACVYVYVNLRHAFSCCTELRACGRWWMEEIGRRRLALFAQALVIASLLLLMTFLFSGERVPGGLDKLLLLVVVTAVVFAQLFEQWAYGQCRRIRRGRRLP